MQQDFPPPKRPPQKGQTPQEAQVRSHQAHGTLSRETRGSSEGEEGGRREGRGTKQPYGKEMSSNLTGDRILFVRKEA
jgi:hypothetical protein